MSTLSHRTAYLYLTTAALFWGGHYVAGKVMIDTVPPMTALFLRSVLSMALMMGAYVYLRQYYKSMWENRWILFWLGAIGTFGFTAFSYVALSKSPVVNVSLMIALCPAVVAIVLHFMKVEKLTLRTLFYCGISILGAMFIVFKGDFNALINHTYNTDDLWAIIPPLMWAAYNILLRYVPEGLNSATILQSQAITTTALSAIAMLVVDGWQVAEINYTPEIIAIIFYLVFFSFLGAYYCYNAATRVLGGFIGALFVNGVPLFASLLGVILLDEILSTYHFIGAGLLFFSLYQLTIKKQL